MSLHPSDYFSQLKRYRHIMMEKLINDLTLILNKSPEEIQDLLKALQVVLVSKFVEASLQSGNPNDIVVQLDLPLFDKCILKDDALVIIPRSDFTKLVKSAINEEVNPLITTLSKKLSQQLSAQYLNGELFNHE